MARKFGKKNHVKVDPFNYSLMMLGEPKIGKTSLLYKVAEKLVGEDGYIFAEFFREKGHSAIEGIVAEEFPTWDDWVEFVDDIVENKTADYADLRVVFADTYDQYILMAEEEAIRLWNKDSVEGKGQNSQNQNSQNQNNQNSNSSQNGNQNSDSNSDQESDQNQNQENQDSDQNQENQENQNGNQQGGESQSKPNEENQGGGNSGPQEGDEEEDPDYIPGLDMTLEELIASGLLDGAADSQYFKDLPEETRLKIEAYLAALKGQN